MYPSRQETLQISWILRVGVVMEFIGHGALGIGRVAAWSSYFAVVGILGDTSLHLMPLVGLFDVAMALTVLFYPMRAVILYMTAWGLWTALLRPLAGESAWEAVERAGNFGALFALFMLSRGGNWKAWLRFGMVDEIQGRLRLRVCWALRLTTVLLLLGHGALGLLVRKPLFSTQYALLGLHGTWVEPAIGAFECVLALVVLLQPGFGILVFVLAWKFATEALSPMAGSPMWVFVEHGGSYAAPLALALLVRRRESPAPVPARTAPLDDLAQGGILRGELFQRLDQRAVAALELLHAPGDHIHQDVGVIDRLEGFLDIVVSHVAPFYGRPRRNTTHIAPVQTRHGQQLCRPPS